MSHMPVGLDLDDLTPKQLRQILRGSMRSSMLSSKKSDKERGEEDEEDDKENDDLVDLHREKTGNSKPPKVTKDDLPKGVTFPEEDGEGPEIASTKKGKK